jgi:hypothetical protein
MAMHGAPALLFAAGLLAGACACSPTPLPGAQLGTFRVVANSKGNTCGLGAPDPWAFDAQLSRNGALVYWSWMDGSPLLSGPVDSSSKAEIQDEQTGNVDGTDAGLGPCTMERQAVLDLDLSGAATGSFRGSIVYTFSAASGADCSDQLASAGAGGQYGALPCTITYSMVGTKQ